MVTFDPAIELWLLHEENAQPRVLAEALFVRNHRSGGWPRHCRTLPSPDSQYRKPQLRSRFSITRCKVHSNAIQWKKTSC